MGLERLGGGVACGRILSYAMKDCQKVDNRVESALGFPRREVAYQAPGSSLRYMHPLPIVGWRNFDDRKRPRHLESIRTSPLLDFVTEGLEHRSFLLRVALRGSFKHESLRQEPSCIGNSKLRVASSQSRPRVDG